MRSISPGKIIIAGEYVGIFGEPIIITAVGLRTEVLVDSLNSGRIVVTSDRFFGKRMEMSVEELINLWDSAKKDYLRYLDSGDIDFLLKYRSEDLLPAILAVAAAMERGFKGGLNIKIGTDLPVGAGLGSSASMVSAVIGSVWTTLEKTFTIQQLNELAYLVERILNGRPSGGDNSGVVYGGWLKFKNEESKLNITRLSNKVQEDGWWLIDGGKPEENTLEMINMVLRNKESKANLFDTLIARERQIIKMTEEQINKGQIDTQLMNESQLVLEQMGVVGEKGRALIDALWKHGVHAKISGAGGLKKGVGTILAYCVDDEKIDAISRKYKFNYQKIVMGVRGWHIEK